MMEAEMRAKAAAVEAMDARDRAAMALSDSSAASGEADAKLPVILLQIDASGNFTLAGRPVLFEDLVSSLTHAKADLPPETRLRIQATTETPFAVVEKAMKAGVDAGLSKQSVDNTSQP
jgi:biopolymer transport protein ExbD